MTLRVSLVLSHDELEIHSELGFVGTWPTESVSVEPVEDNWFRLRLHEDEWRFRPDDPNAFLLAAPLPKANASHKPTQVGSRALSRATHMVIGAVLAVVLLSVGIVIGRNQLDGTGLRLTSMLVLAAALGAGWASFGTTGRSVSERRDQPGASVTINARRTPMRVEDVIRGTDRRETDLHDEVEPRSDGPVAPRNAPGEPQSSDESRTQPSPETPSVDSIAGNGLATPTGADAPLDVSSHEPETVARPSSIPSVESSHSDLGEETDDVGLLESAATPEREEHTDARPGWVSIVWEDGREAIDLRDPDADSAGVADDEVLPDEASDASILPTEAIKRYLASLSGLEAGAHEGNGNGRDEGGDPVEDEGETAGPEHQGLALTDIRGIGPALSTALTQLGVGGVHDLAHLESDDLDYLQEQLGRFGPRIRSERWVEQARQMIQNE